MRNHLNACNRRPKKDIRQQIIAMDKSNDDSSSRLSTYKFDPEVEREKFAKMVMKHDLPFLFAEYEYVRDWVSYICPMFKFRSRNTLRTDCTKVFDDQKAKVYRTLGQNTSRISLTTDLWTPKHQRLGYCCVTCHFIDNEWIFHKKIIAFQWVQCPHSGEVLAEWMKT